MESTYLGIDLGTSAMKMVLIDGNKRVLNQITEEYQAAKSDKGWSEIDPEIWFACMVSGMERIFAHQDRRSLKRIGVTGQMHSLVVLDENGRSIRPALMWNDLRTRNLIPELKEKIKHFPDGDYLSRTISTGSPAANLYWLKENEPENFRRIHKFLIGPDYLVHRLTGGYSTDYCEASTSCLFEISSRRWSADMQKLIGLPKAAYPEVSGSALSAGILTEEMANRLGLDREVEVLVGTGDNPATAISTGCLGRGYPVISLGTSGVLMMPVAELKEQAKGKIILFSFDNKAFSCLVQGVVQSNGSTFDWWTKKIMGINDPDEIDKRINPEQAVNSEVLFYPHLTGDKTIYADPDIRGAFIGLGLDTDKYTLLYSVIEGLCFSLRELAEKMRLPLKKYGGIKVVGGGSKSRLWMQTLANVLNLSVEKMDGMIGAAFGIALLAVHDNDTALPFKEITKETVTVECRFEPEPGAVQACEKKYERYLRIRKGMQYISED